MEMFPRPSPPCPRTLFALGLLLLAFSAISFSCRHEKANPLASYCGKEKPEPSHPQPFNEFRTEPLTPPYQKVSYVWYCLEGNFVQENWTRTENNCWVKEEEYRRENPGCS